MTSKEEDFYDAAVGKREALIINLPAKPTSWLIAMLSATAMEAWELTGLEDEPFSQTEKVKLTTLLNRYNRVLNSLSVEIDARVPPRKQ